MHTGHGAERAGIYWSMCCHQAIQIKKGEILPYCKSCNDTARWLFIRPLGHQMACVSFR